MGEQGNERAREWESKGMGGQGNERAREFPLMRIAPVNCVRPLHVRVGYLVPEKNPFAGTRTQSKWQPTLSEVPPERERLVRIIGRSGCRFECTGQSMLLGFWGPKCRRLRVR